jgi:hypothetical protein
MTEETLRDELLKQHKSGHAGAASPLETELAALHRLIDGERRRARRLTIWTVIVWAVWLLLIAAAFGVPVLAYHAARSDGPRPAATQPVNTTPPANVPPHPNRHGGVGIVGLLIGGLFVAGLLGLPVLGVVLLALMILGRRTATTHQIRASLAALDAKLRLLTAPGSPPASGPEQ